MESHLKYLTYPMEDRIAIHYTFATIGDFASWQPHTPPPWILSISRGDFRQSARDFSRSQCVVPLDTRRSALGSTPLCSTSAWDLWIHIPRSSHFFRDLRVSHKKIESLAAIKVSLSASYFHEDFLTESLQREIFHP